MADWRQIQARIRKAKNSPDAPTKLNELFQRTRDGMVAWELALVEEEAEHLEEAGRWYTIAAQRFRRSDWRKKAEEALTRLGLELPSQPAPGEILPTRAASIESPTIFEVDDADTDEVQAGELEGSEGAAQPEEGAIADPQPPVLRSDGASAAGSAMQGAAGEPPLGKRKRRRGRRGGRGRRRKGMGGEGLPSQAFAQSAEPQQARPTLPQIPGRERPSLERGTAVEPPTPYERPSRGEAPVPRLPSERSAHGHGRGEPALASRMAHLESLLRRLVQSPLHTLDECDDAPAGPGVFLLSDSDQVTTYYVEACQTLRIGTGNLARGGRGNRGGRGHSNEAGLKARLAEYLGINEAKVSQYMNDHCVLRWIQLDDEAPQLAHFAIGVLRTPLNLD